MKWWNRVSCKVAALVLPVLLVAGLMPPVQAAAVDYVITGVVDRQLAATMGLDGLISTPGFLLDTANFVWSGTQPPRVTSSILTQNNISLGFSDTSGDGHTLNRVGYYDRINGVSCGVFISFNVSDYDVKPYSGEVFLKMNDVIVEGTRTAISGYAIGNKVIVIPDYDEPVGAEVRAGCITYALGDNLDVDLGVALDSGDYHDEGVSILLPSVSRGEIFTGWSSTVPDAADLAVFAAHPQIVGVHSVTVSDNLKRGKMQISGSPYYIYSENLTYLGYMQPTTYSNELIIDFHDKYYIAISPLGQTPPQMQTITYDGNGATGGDVPSPHQQYSGHRVSVRGDSDVGNFIYRDGYYFGGWNTAPNGSGTRYAMGDSLTMPNYSFTLYAMWATHAVRYMSQEPYFIMPNGYTTLEDLVDMEILPGTELKFYLRPEGFIWWDDKVPDSLSMDVLYDLAIRTSTRGGSQLIDTAGLLEDAQGVYISIVFAEYYVDGRLELTVYPVIDGRRQDDYAFTITGTMIDDGRRPPVTNPGGTGGGGRGGSGGSGSGGGTVYAAPDTARAAATPAVQQPAAVSESRAVELVKGALPGARNGVATVRMTGAGDISLDTLKAMVKAAGGTALKVNADSLNADKSVDVRLSFDPAAATKGLSLYASTTSGQAQAVKAHLNKWFDNTVTVVAFAQKGALGMPVEVCVKVDSALALKDLQFYHYDRAANVYNRIAAPNYWVDRNGYVHFTTTLGDNIIITDRAMARKA